MAYIRRGGQYMYCNFFQAARSRRNTLNKIYVQSKVKNCQWLKVIQFTKYPPLIIVTLRYSTDYVNAGSALVSDGCQVARDKGCLVATIGGAIYGASNKYKGVIG